MLSLYPPIFPPARHPTLDEVVSWARSFEQMMRSVEGRDIFREFLRSEYSEENLLFWIACEDLKKESNPTTIEEKARIIYEDYVSILSPKEVVLRLTSSHMLKHRNCVGLFALVKSISFALKAESFFCAFCFMCIFKQAVIAYYVIHFLG